MTPSAPPHPSSPTSQRLLASPAKPTAAPDVDPDRPRVRTALCALTFFVLLSFIIFSIGLPLPRAPPPPPLTPSSPSSSSSSTTVSPSTAQPKSPSTSLPLPTTHPVTQPSSASSPPPRIAIPLPFSHPSAAHPHACRIVGHDRTTRYLWPFNARAYCLTSALCLRPSTPTALPHIYTAASLSSTTCGLDHPMLHSLTPPFELNCTQIQHRYVHIAHGRFRGTLRPTAPVLHNLAALSNIDNTSATHLPGVAVFIPPFPFTANIFHFSFIAGAVTQLVVSLSTLHTRWRGFHTTLSSPPVVTVVFRALDIPEAAGWRHGLWDILVRRRMQHSGQVTVRTVHLTEDAEGGGTNRTGNTNAVLCAQSAVLLGNRGNVNLWPYPNNSALPVDGSAVALESVRLRRAVYDEYAIVSRLPKEDKLPRRTTFDLPPLVLGYSQRNALRDPPAGQYVDVNTTRRFNDADEKWFQRMILEEGVLANVPVRQFRLMGNEDLGEQVRLFESVGFLVGIHGANLVNALFMRPFGALMELMPGKSILSCYVAGANSGLMYSFFEGEVASPEESQCPPWRKTCLNFPRDRLVKVRSMEHRRQVRMLVRKGLGDLRRMHKRFPDGVPVQLDEEEGRYVVEGNSER